MRSLPVKFLVGILLLVQGFASVGRGQTLCIAVGHEAERAAQCSHGPGQHDPSQPSCTHAARQIRGHAGHGPAHCGIGTPRHEHSESKFHLHVPTADNSTPVRLVNETMVDLPLFCALVTVTIVEWIPAPLPIVCAVDRPPNWPDSDQAQALTATRLLL